MSFRASWQLTDPDEKIDQTALVGTFEVTDGVSTIISADTYVESWLEGVLNAALQLRAGAVEATVEIPEEAEEGLLTRQKDEVVLSFGGQNVRANDLEEVVEAMVDSAKRLIAASGGVPTARATTLSALQDAITRANEKA